MTAQEIVDRIGAKLPGQQMLFSDPDLILRQTPFKATGDQDFDRQWLIHWWMVSYIPDSYKSLEKVDYEKVYKHYSNALWSHFTFSRPNGYIAETNQSCIDLMCYKDQPTADHIKELELWLPYIKPREVDDDENENLKHKVKYIKLFEHTLSRWCLHYIYIYPDKCEFRTGRSYSSEVRCTGTLAEVVNYCRTRHWYEKRLHSNPDKPEDDEDD